MEQGSWKAKVLVRDKVKLKSFIVNLDLNAKRGSDLRMDVTTPLGQHVASMVVRNDDVEYLIVNKKKFYRGKAKPKVLRPIITVPMDPRIIYNILFDIPVAKKDWNCESNDKDMLKKCNNEKLGLNIEWKDRVNSSKRVHVDHKKASLQMNFYEFKPELKEMKNLFSLTPPKSFKVYRIR